MDPAASMDKPMKNSFVGAPFVVSVALIVSACVVIEDFDGYSPLNDTTSCDGRLCSSSSSASGAGGNSTMASSSSSSGNAGPSSSSSSSATSSSSSSSGDPGTSSSSSSGGGTQPSVACNGMDCFTTEGEKGCCVTFIGQTSCTTIQNCSIGAMYYCDGPEDCGGSSCCRVQLKGVCAAQCATGSMVCKNNMDCPPGKTCTFTMGFPFGTCS